LETGRYFGIMGGASNDRYSCILKVEDTNFSLKKIAKTLIGYFAKRRTLAWQRG